MLESRGRGGQWGHGLVPSNFVDIKKGREAKIDDLLKLAPAPHPTHTHIFGPSAISVASCFSDTHKKVSQFETSVHALFFVGCMKVILKLKMSSLLRIVLSYENL